MLYDPINRTLTLGKKDCPCGDGTESTPIPCPRCKGTGDGPRGGRGRCRECYGSGKRYDQDNRRPCTRCGGDYYAHDDENWCDNVPQQALDAMPLIVVYADRGTSWNESYLGLGCLWSVTDYGDAWDAHDPARLLAVVRGDMRRVQGVKIVRDHKQDLVDVDRCTECGEMGPAGQPCPKDGTHVMAEEWIGEKGSPWGHRFQYRYDKPTVPVCDAVVVIVSHNGYSVRPWWADDEDDSIARAAREPGLGLAMTLGMAVYNEGGNGTMAAALPLPKEV